MLFRSRLANAKISIPAEHCGEAPSERFLYVLTQFYFKTAPPASQANLRSNHCAANAWNCADTLFLQLRATPAFDSFQSRALGTSPSSVDIPTDSKQTVSLKQQ